MSKETYADYLESNHWQNLRVLCHAKFAGKCVICQNESSLQCHHWLYRKTFQETKLDDLALLCDSCHSMVHKDGSHKMTPNQLSAKYSRFFVNVPQAPITRPPHPGSNEWKLAIRARNKGKPAIVKPDPNEARINGFKKKLNKLLRKQEKETSQLSLKSRKWQITKLKRAINALIPRQGYDTSTRAAK